MFAQQSLDTLKLRTEDSLRNIPLELLKFESANPFVLNKLDSLSSILPIESAESSIELNGNHPSRFWSPNQNYGQRLFDHGYHGLRFNNGPIENYTFISPSKPISEIELKRGRAFANSQASFQDNYDLNLIFASRFKNQVIWNLMYNRQNNKGIYNFNGQKNTLFNTGVAYSNQNNSFASSLIFSDERHRSEDNWGITQDSFLSNSNFKVRESVPVNNTTAISRQFERSLSFHIHYHFPLQHSFFKPAIGVQTVYSLFSYAYKDAGNPLNPELYGLFYVDSFAIQNLLKNKWFHQKINFQLLESKWIQTSFELQYESNKIDHDSLSQNVSTGAFRLLNHINRLGKWPVLTTLSLKTNDNEFAFEGDLETKLLDTKYLLAQLKLFYHNTAVSYVYQFLNLNQSYFWSNHFETNYNTEFGLRSEIQTKGKLNNHLMVNLSRFSSLVHLDSLSLPLVVKDISYANFSWAIQYKFKKWNVQNQMMLQVYHPDPFRWNGWNSDHSLSYNLNLFKQIVSSEFGVQVKLYQYDYKFRFNPIIQSFYSGTVSNEFIYTLGMFMHFKVSDFKFSIYADHLDLFWNKTHPELIQNYPFYDFFFRFGINWKFIN